MMLSSAAFELKPPAAMPAMTRRGKRLPGVAEFGVQLQWIVLHAAMKASSSPEGMSMPGTCQDCKPALWGVLALVTSCDPAQESLRLWASARTVWDAPTITSAQEISREASMMPTSSSSLSASGESGHPEPGSYITHGTWLKSAAILLLVLNVMPSIYVLSCRIFVVRRWGCPAWQ